MDTRTGEIFELSDAEAKKLLEEYTKRLKEAIGEVEEEQPLIKPLKAVEPLEMVPVKRPLSKKEKRKKRIRPNSFCACGSRKRFKNCCLIRRHENE